MPDSVTDTNLTDAVIYRPGDDSAVYDSAFLVNLGFTAVLLPPDEHSAELTDTSKRQPLRVLPPDDVAGANATLLNDHLRALGSGEPTSAHDLWNTYESIPSGHCFTELNLSPGTAQPGIEIALMVQLALRPVPIVHLGTGAQPLSRDVESYLRSLIFWRKRFHIERMTPRLVHAGEDGMLIFVLDSWLVAINGNDEEMSIDVGSSGAMWLMLATHRDVHLHGSVLLLPAYSGAILANELAR